MEVTQEGYQPYRATIEIRPNETTTLQVALVNQAYRSWLLKRNWSLTGAVVSGLLGVAEFAAARSANGERTALIKKIQSTTDPEEASDLHQQAQTKTQEIETHNNQASLLLGTSLGLTGLTVWFWFNEPDLTETKVGQSSAPYPQALALSYTWPW